MPTNDRVTHGMEGHFSKRRSRFTRLALGKIGHAASKRFSFSMRENIIQNKNAIRTERVLIVGSCSYARVA